MTILLLRRQSLGWVYVPDGSYPPPIYCSGASATSCPDYATVTSGIPGSYSSYGEVPFTNHEHPPDLNTGIPALCHSAACNAGPGFPAIGLGA